VSLLPQTGAAQRVLALLPVHVLARDEEAGGLLAALIDAVAGELEVLERDIDALYASWFVETCPEWVVPYLADLVGVTDLPPDLPGVTSRRAFLGNTIRFRQGKGTLAVIEQAARDASGWPAKAVEFYRLLAATTHVDHVRTDRPATASVRTPVAASGPLELLPSAVAQGALHRVAHTAEVRRIASGRGLYGIPGVGAFLFPHQVHELVDAAASPPAAAGEGWSVHPLGLPSPLFAVPLVEAQIEHLAAEADLPVPLRPRRLLALLAAARGAAARGEAVDIGALPVGVRVDGEELDAERIRVHRLEDLARDAAGVAPAGWQVMVDAVDGRVHPFRDGLAATPASVQVRHSYGATADVGAGSHDRTAIHDEVLAADPYRGDPARGGPGVTAQYAVLADAPADPDDLTESGVAEALATAEVAWAGDDSPAGGTLVIAVGDSARYPVDAAGPIGVTVSVPEATRLVLVAAAWRARTSGPGEVLPPLVGAYDPQGLRPRLRGDVTVTGAGGSSVVLDGLVVEGDVVVAAGALGSLTLSGCTVSGTVRVGEGAATNPDVVVRVVRSRCGAVALGTAAATLEVVDSTLDGAGADAVIGPGLHLSVDGATIVGGVRARTLEGSNAILDGRVVVENRQVGCLRYSFAPRSSRVPRRYRCSPSPTADPGTRPTYGSTDRGSPDYLTLAPGCPPEIAEGGEGGTEMGVHHHIARPVRVRSTSRLLVPYVPVGLELGVRAPVALGRS
jgi:Phage tail protein (Tail_P2_I)